MDMKSVRFPVMQNISIRPVENAPIKKYFKEASSINFGRSMKYGLGVIGNSVLFRLNKWGLAKSGIYQKPERKLNDEIKTGQVSLPL